jgi:hypothetical protein
MPLLFRAGDWVIDLDGLRSAQRNAPREGGLRISYASGPAVNLTGTVAASVWAELCRLVPLLRESDSRGGRDVPRRPPPDV